MVHIFINDYFFRFSRTKLPFDLTVLKHILNSMSLYFALLTAENNKTKKSIKFQRVMLNFYFFYSGFCIYHKSCHLNLIYVFEIKSISKDHLPYLQLHFYNKILKHGLSLPCTTHCNPRVSAHIAWFSANDRSRRWAASSTCGTWSRVNTGASQHNATTTWKIRRITG